MGDHHHFGRSSLFLASHDRAHREHLHKHHLSHRADTGGVVGAIVTEVQATVSVIQQVTVDSNGITLGLFTFTADSTGGTYYPPTTTEKATPSIKPATPGTSSTGLTASSTSASGPGHLQASNAASSSQSLPSSIHNSRSSSAASPPSSIPTTFASILTNSTSCKFMSNVIRVKRYSKVKSLRKATDQLTSNTSIKCNQLDTKFLQLVDIFLNSF